MDVGNSVRKAINDWEDREFDSAMLHACNAVDGTAAKAYPSISGSNARFTTLLRDHYPILGAMGIPGVNLEETRFPIKVKAPKAPGGMPDLADIIYGIHRCSHGHGDTLPDGFELLPDAAGVPRFTRIEVEEGKIRFSDRIIFALLAVAVLSPVNADQKVPDGYSLTYGEMVLLINEWWGRAADFLVVIAQDSIPQVKLDFAEWMSAVK
jgi:hypothetical protein